MTKQLSLTKSIQEQIFNEETILRASTMYNRYINVRLDELHQAIATENEVDIAFNKSELFWLRKNLEELEFANPTKTIKKQVNVLTPKNIARALACYNSYVDVYLDLLSSAIKVKDTEKINEIKVSLGKLQQNIWKLKMVCN